MDDDSDEFADLGDFDAADFDALELQATQAAPLPPPSQRPPYVPPQRPAINHNNQHHAPPANKRPRLYGSYDQSVAPVVHVSREFNATDDDVFDSHRQAGGLSLLKQPAPVRHEPYPRPQQQQRAPSYSAAQSNGQATAADEEMRQLRLEMEKVERYSSLSTLSDYYTFSASKRN